LARFISELDFIDDEMRSASSNMALDQALLETCVRPTLRIYGWKRPSLSFGYFGRYIEAEECAAGRELVRRWTGGGIVLHGEDLTYALIVPADRAGLGSTTIRIYQLVHEGLCLGLRRLGLSVDLLQQPAPKVSEACFANPVRFDLVCDGRKIAGAAQRRTKQGLLQQGSVQIGLERPLLSRVFAESLARSISPVLVSEDVLQRAAHLAETRYSTNGWQKMR
jgi:lipoate-protein ligase A